MNISSWDGYAYDVPSGPRAEARSDAAEIHLRRLLYARVLSQIGRRSATGAPELEAQAWAAGLGPWIAGESSPTYLRPVAPVLVKARSCGRGAGLRRICDGDHSFFTPLGCGSPWCLRCSGLAADMRASRVHRDLRALADVCAKISSRRPPIVRIVLTLSDEARAPVIEGGRSGAAEMLRQARRVLTKAAGSNGTMPLMLTLHPTSSSKPWLKRPHIEAFALWLDLEGYDVQPLPWLEPGRPVDVEAVRSGWSAMYPGSIDLHASYYRWDEKSESYSRRSRQGRQSLSWALRYALRGFNEDVWWSAAKGTLGAPGGSMAELLNPRREPALRGDGTHSAEVVAGLEAEGGVLLWPRMHRVRRSGALASRGFRARLAALHAAAGSSVPDWSPICKCPECGERLIADTYEDDEGRSRVLLVRADEAEEWGLTLLPARGRARGVTS